MRGNQFLVVDRVMSLLRLGAARRALLGLSDGVPVRRCGSSGGPSGSSSGSSSSGPSGDEGGCIGCSVLHLVYIGVCGWLMWETVWSRSEFMQERRRMQSIAKDMPK
jgi:hypothetical protein